jgi:hypothetical protein
MISHSKLMHYKIQAAIRENNIPKSEIKYLGEGEGTYWYRINNTHTVSVEQIENFERVND